MFRRFSASFALLSILLDASLVAFSLYAAAFLRPYFNQIRFVAYLPAPVILPSVVYIIAVLVWIAVLFLMGVYDGRKNYRAVDEFSSLTFGALIAGVSLAGVLYLSYREVSRALFLTFFGFTYLSQAGWRVGVRLSFRREALHSPTVRRVLIVGGGSLGRSVGEQIQAFANLGWLLVGYLDDQAAGSVAGVRILGQVNQVRSVVYSHKIDDVLIALPQGTHAATNQLLADLHDLPVKIWAVPDYFSLSLQRAKYENFVGLAMLDLQAPALTDLQRLVKRVVDIILSILLLPPASVLMGLIAITIRLESRAPAIFMQARIGEGGRLFYMYKFRTMVAGAESMQENMETNDASCNLVYKQPDDPRVTRFGRMLRRSSLDELPQLFNILRGEMSWVGPRPELPYLVERYQPWQQRRLAVPQGLTGWWQVNGRSDRPMHLHTEDDLYYIQHYSLGLDFKILLMTIMAVLRGRGAY